MLLRYEEVFALVKVVVHEGELATDCVVHAAGLDIVRASTRYIDEAVALRCHSKSAADARMYWL